MTLYLWLRVMTLTFAEMPLSEKNKISHRARAFEGLLKFLC